MTRFFRWLFGYHGKNRKLRRADKRSMKQKLDRLQKEDMQE